EEVCHIIVGMIHFCFLPFTRYTPLCKRLVKLALITQNNCYLKCRDVPPVCDDKYQKAPEKASFKGKVSAPMAKLYLVWTAEILLLSLGRSYLVPESLNVIDSIWWTTDS
ncbi:hypothetical protein NDU88_005482, partial [Pleurodeles waltl]